MGSAQSQPSGAPKSAATHTPGPWRVEQGTALVWGRCNPDDNSSRGMGIPIAEARLNVGGRDYHSRLIDHDVADANARLIAAAPELLAALINFIGALEFSQDYHRDLGNADQALVADKLDAARSAIAIATGAAS